MKTKKKIFNHKILFTSVFIICIVFLVFVHFFINKSEHVSNKILHRPTVFDNFEFFEGDLDNPVDITEAYTTKDTLILKSTIPEDLDYNSALGFYTTHMNVHIYVEDELVYEFNRVPDDMFFGKSPGHSYNFIDSIYGHRGKEMYIHLDCPYTIDKELIPVFFIGDTADIVVYETYASSEALVFGYTLIVLGIASIIIWLLFRKNISQGDLTLCHAGLFSILLATWTISKQPILSYYSNNNILISYLSSISVMLAPISLILFFRELCKNKSNKLWDILLIINYINVIGTIIIQILNIADFRNSLYINLVVFSISLIITLIYSAYLTYKQRSTKEGRIHFLCIILLSVGYINYIYAVYTETSYSLSYGSFFVNLFIIIIVNMYIRRSIAVMSKSDQAEFYENLAYKDSLTGLFNRLAYDRAISAVDVNSASYIIVIFDLNNLKHFNDTYGHNMGDTYIKDSSYMIQQAFKTLGNVYRIGGDEFCIIMQDKSIFQYETATRELDTLMYNYNRVSEVLKINIAYGYAQYDKKIDRDIHETRNRADAMMYEKKFFMKQNQVQQL